MIIIDDNSKADPYLLHWMAAIFLPLVFVMVECFSMWLDFTCMVKAEGKTCCCGYCDIWTCNPSSCAGYMACTFHCLLCRWMGNNYFCRKRCCRCICAPKYIKCRCTKFECWGLVVTFFAAMLAGIFAFLSDSCHHGEECDETYENQALQIMTFHFVYSWAHWVQRKLITCCGCKLGYFKCQYVNRCFSV